MNQAEKNHSKPDKFDEKTLSPQDNNRIKSQIDALLENDFKVLSRHPNTPQ